MGRGKCSEKGRNIANGKRIMSFESQCAQCFKTHPTTLENLYIKKQIVHHDFFNLQSVCATFSAKKIPPKKYFPVHTSTYYEFNYSFPE